MVSWHFKCIEHFLSQRNSKIEARRLPKTHLHLPWILSLIWNESQNTPRNRRQEPIAEVLMFTVSRFWSVKKPPESCGIELLVLDPTMTPTSTSTIPKAKKTNVTWESVVPLATQSHHRRSTSIAKINLVCGGRREESTVMLDISQTQKSKSATCSQAWKQHQYLEVLHSVPSWTQCEHHYISTYMYLYIYVKTCPSRQHYIITS